MDDDGFEDFSDDEPEPAPAPAPAPAPEPSGAFPEEDRSMIPSLGADERAKLEAAFDRFTEGDPSRGMAGAQLVEVTAKTGLDQRDLSAMWQLVATPGSPTLARDDFCLFMHILRHRANGGELPASMSRDDRARIFAESGGERPVEPAAAAAAAAPAPPPASPIVVVVESFGGIKDGSKLANMNVAVTLVDADGEPLEPTTTTPMGAATAKSDGRVVFEAPVTTRATHGSLPAGSAMLFELRHFKAKEKKMSVKCWAFAPAEDIAPGARGEYPTLTKPTDPKRKKTTHFTKGAPDVRVRFA